VNGLYSYPGRRTISVPIPRDLLDAADRIAADRGLDRALVLGDLVAAELPNALADAARELLDSESNVGEVAQRDREARSP
jgi:hypothetical protein